MQQLERDKVELRLQLNLRGVLSDLGQTQSALAKFLRTKGKGTSNATVSLICLYDSWPKSRKGLNGREALVPLIEQFLKMHGASAQQLETAFERKHAEFHNVGEPQQRCSAAGAPVSHGRQAITAEQEDLTMLLRHQRLTPEARQHFRILRDPFVNEMGCADDVFVSEDIRYVRAAVRQTALHGGMLAVSGESGSGKSTIRKDLQAWIQSSEEPIVVIEPYVVSMSASGKGGKPLLASDITGAVIRSLSPSAVLRMSNERRTEQMHSILRESARVGNKHVLVIEEAHDLAVPTLKSMKRLYELEDGFRKLLSIVLIGQPELAMKLSERNPEVREVVQRCELVKLPPLDNNVQDYLTHKFKRVGVDAQAVLDVSAIEAVRAVLRRQVMAAKGLGGGRESQVQSLCYPLAINNLMTRAMNAAVAIGAPQVNAELVHAAIRGE